MAIEIVDLSIKMVIFHSYVSLPEGRIWGSHFIVLDLEVFSFPLLVRVGYHWGSDTGPVWKAGRNEAP
jgi:hypothetical protein